MSEAGSETFLETSHTLLELMKEHNLVNGSIADGLGNKVSIKRNKYGFYTMNVTSRMDGDEGERK